MEGVGGDHKPVILAPAANENQAQGTNKAEGCFGRFKVSLPKTIKQFFSSIFSTKPRDLSIQLRYTKLHNPTPQQPVSDAKINSSPEQADGKFDEALSLAKGNTHTQQCFADVCDTLEELQTHKNDLRHLRRGTDEFRMCSLEIQLVKADYQEAVRNFNNTVSSDLKIDSSRIETAMANKHSPQFTQNYAQYQKMKNTLL